MNDPTWLPQELIELACSQSYTALYADYPHGFGQTSLAVTYDSPNDIFGFCIAVVQELDADIATDLFDVIRTDQLGRGYIAYFPGFRVRSAKKAEYARLDEEMGPIDPEVAL